MADARNVLPKEFMVKAFKRKKLKINEIQRLSLNKRLQN